MLASRKLSLESLESRRLLAFSPSADEQELLQLVNRFRTDPTGEFSRLIAVTSPLRARDPVLQIDLDYAQVNGSVLQSQLAGLSAVPPLAWNEAIYNFAKSHNDKMLATNPKQQFHSNSLERRQALLSAGVNLRNQTGEKITSENVYGYGKSPLHTFAAWVIDWERGGPNGMRADLGHRVAINNSDFEQIGQAITAYGGGDFGPQVNTQVLANIQNAPTMVVGAVFEDRNKSAWYEAGEGLGSVQIVFQGSPGTFTTSSLGTGGYQIALPAGTYTATASGGGIRHSIVATGITVDQTNVWRNLIYDPSAIPPDVLEANNSASTATLLTGGPQTLGSLSIHTPSDIDYFRLESKSSGLGTFSIQFSNAEGNLDLALLNASGSVIAVSNSTGDIETISANLTRGMSYYLQVNSVGGAQNANYSLAVNPPAPAPPIAELDRAVVSSLAPTVQLNVVANDRDPDGPASQLTAQLASGSPLAFSMAANTVTYTAPANFSGVHRANYTVTDDQGLSSAPGTIEIFVLNLGLAKPWHNGALPTDVNDDGITSPLDALLIINEINARKSRSLTSSAGGVSDIFGFMDTSGDEFLSGLDVLLVVNKLNAAGGEGESPAGPTHISPALNDVALLQLMAADAYSSSQRRTTR